MGLLIGFVVGVTICTLLGSLPDWRLLLCLGGASCCWRPAMGLQGVWWLLRGLLLGLAYAVWQAESRLANALPTSLEGEKRLLVGAVRDLPVKTQTGQRVLFEVEQPVSTDGRIPQRLQLTMDRKAGDWPAGSRWRVLVRLRGRHATANQYGQDTERWLWSQGIQASGRVLEPALRLADASDLRARLDRLRARLVQRIDQVLPGRREAALIKALTVGEQHAISRQDWQLFSRTGLTHLVSISGVHVSMLAMLAAWGARGMLRRVWPASPVRVGMALVGLLAAGSYSVLAGWAVPARRTFVMLAVAGVMLYWRRSGSPMQTWWLALALVLLLDPFAVYVPGLWLSFGLVAGLIMGGIGRCQPRHGWRAVLHAQWVASIISLLPLLGLFFSWPLISPLANLLAIPWISLLVSPLALLAMVLPLDGLLILTAGLARIFYWVIEHLAEFPAWRVSAVPWYLLLPGLLGAIWLIAPAGMHGRALAVLLLLPVLWPTVSRPKTGEFQAVVFDVGQGLAVLVRTRQHTLLYDTGAMAADRVLLPQLTGRGVRRLDMLMLSHHDADHDGAAADLVRAVPVSQLVVGQAASVSSFTRDFRLCRAGQRWQWDGVDFQILAPPAELLIIDKNAGSCVLRISQPQGALLLTGDIPVGVEADLVARHGKKLKSTVLLVPHHGSLSSSSLPFLRAVSPNLAIISAGYANRYGHPAALVLMNYQQVNSGLLRTDLHGEVELTFSAHLTVKAYRQHVVRHWRGH